MMERFTGRNENGDLTLCGEQVYGNKQNAFYNALSELEQYELTGLEPDEIPQWIPVNERLPVESEYREKDTGELIPLLVCVKDTKYPFRAMYDGKSWGDGISKLDVTYWMSLPQPPKGEK